MTERDYSMKYIRTKEKVYEVVEENERYYKCCYDKGCITLVAKFDNDVNGFSKALKTADTIEELCDEFRYEFDNFLKHERCWLDVATGIYHDFDNDTALNEIEISTIKGGIWTDTGLIYVAKMNDKGELELI